MTTTHFKSLVTTLAFSCAFSLSTHAYAWELETIGADSPVNVWTEVVPGSNFKAFKGEVVIEADIKTVLNVVTDTENYPNWYHNNKEARKLKKVGEHQYLSYSITKAPWPVSNRDTVTLTTKSELKNGYLITVSARPDAYPRQESMVRIEKLEGFWKLETVGNHQTRVTLQIKAEPGGDLPSWLANSTVIDMPFYTLTNLKHQIESIE